MTEAAPPRPHLYLDHAATGPVRPEVVEAMTVALTATFGNPSSRHRLGLEAEELLDRARRTVAARLGLRPGERLVFTSGGTEANALALLGAARAAGRRGRHVLVSAVEHVSVLASAGLLEREGFSVERLPVRPDGRVDLDAAAGLARPDTVLLAVLHVQNETGVVQPAPELARSVRARSPSCLVLVDAVQSFTLLPAGLSTLGADLLSVSGHKIGGPKGIGALVVGTAAKISPLVGGGEQESGLRPGTENVAGAVGMARAVELAPADPSRICRARDRLEEAFLSGVRHGVVLGRDAPRAPHIASLAVPGVPSELLANLLESRGVCVSTGAACGSRRRARSHVLEAMGVPPSTGVVRVSLGHSTLDSEVDEAVRILSSLGPDLARAPRGERAP
jgi:cysteine desulfurase